MANKSSASKDFILDCCNAKSSKMKKYESQKDIYLAGYFALKRKISKKSTRGSKSLSKKPYGLLAYLKTPKLQKQSPSSKSFPSKPSVFHPISGEEFRALISKYRER
jgi:hypothetical protein